MSAAMVECGICGDYSVKGIEVHEVCLDMLARTAGTAIARCETWEHNGTRRGAMVQCESFAVRTVTIDGRSARVCDYHGAGR